MCVCNMANDKKISREMFCYFFFCKAFSRESEDASMRGDSEKRRREWGMHFRAGAIDGTASSEHSIALNRMKQDEGNTPLQISRRGFKCYSHMVVVCHTLKWTFLTHVIKCGFSHNMLKYVSWFQRHIPIAIYNLLDAKEVLNHNLRLEKNILVKHSEMFYIGGGVMARV